MKAARLLLDFFLFTFLFTACCATGLCMATERLVNSQSPALFTRLHLFVFGSTLLVYNVHCLYKIAGKNGLGGITRHIITGAIGLGLVVFNFAALPNSIIAGCLFLGFLSFAYSLPILPFTKKKRIRDYGWLKIVALTSVWTAVTSVLPILYWGHRLAEYPFETLLRFAFIFSLCIIFDLRDVRKDASERIHTLPNILGLHNSYKMIDAAIALFVLAAVLQYVRFPIWERLAGAVITAAITRFVAAYLRRHSSPRAYLLLGDGMMLVYAVLVFILP